MKVSQYIQQLLFDHDCVIIPGFGGFVCNYSPARIHPVDHTIDPPSKKIAFNKNLKNNDGLLINYIRQEDKSSFSEATEKVKAFVRKCDQKLNNKETIVFPKIGKLYLDPEDNLQFRPDYSVNYLLSSYGLPTIQFNPVQQIVNETAVAEEIEQKQTDVMEPVEKGERTEEKSHPEKAKRKKKRRIPESVFLSIIILLLGAMTLQLTVFKNSAPKISFTDEDFRIQDTNVISFVKNLFNGNQHPPQAYIDTIVTPTRGKPDREWDLITDQPADKEKAADNNSSEDLLAEAKPEKTEENKSSETEKVENEAPASDLTLDKNKTEEEKAEEKTAPEKVENEDEPAAKEDVQKKKITKGDFAIIVGAFKEEANAKKKARELQMKGYTATTISAPNGYFRVGIDGYATRTEAKNVLSSVRKNVNAQAWILRY